MNNSSLHSKKIQGFTLVEMLIVLGLFSFIMTLATGVLYTTQAINVKLQETQSILDNVNLSMDAMSREIRYGSDFHCAATLEESNPSLRKSCSYDTGGGSFLFFKPVDAVNASDRVAYYASTTSSSDIIYKDEYFSGIVNGPLTKRYQITANDVNIKSLTFYLIGANTTTGSPTMDVDSVHDNVQPLITINLSGETKPVMSSASSTKFVIELSVAARSLDK